MSFADLGLSDELLKAVADAGYTEPTPIQAQAIPAVLMMKDLIGIAQTGTGKTASFVLPMIDVLASGRRRARMPRSLILEPTRELAAQVAENFEKYGANHDLKMALLIGGVQMGDQLKALDEGCDVLIATPGRLMDLFERGKIMLNGCELLVIDEADRMLDMGFIPDIEFICDKLPTTRQTMLFSATMPPVIKKLADKFLTNPKQIEVSRAASANENITAFKVMMTPRKKHEALKWFLHNDNVGTAIVFSNKKVTVRDLAKKLKRDGFKVGEIHGDMDQSSRIAELELFKSGAINILVASDVAARGLDIKGVSHVFNYDTPWHPDDYVHRVGRTGRAGAKGRAFTFVTAADAEAISNVEKLTGGKIDEYKPGSPAGSVEGKPVPKKAASKSEDLQIDASKQDSAPKERSDKPRRAPRKPRASKDDAPAAQVSEAQPSEPKPTRRAVSDKKPERAKRPYRDHDTTPIEPGEWNGPLPGFLDVSAL
ncbi:DEAD/DEAH box helicase [Pontixanthobacter gangjinensis]|uniref:DEAD-box ATP-dependent RNA helicase RhpA n=1 Tax=Pontixanthobacter gangjinensis TaxID=1028742 RepID=A0A6I4SPG2_9SPHN|nr:DEAD/DEAH box helicase [Pontixanthobacter gangjinensis]MXO56727.1 DEAD/DEAH box helicase [Pontixanthobacter gangjinensis]